MKYIIGNWKMNPLTERAALKLFMDTQKNLPTKLTKVKVITAPPYIFLAALRRVAKKISLSSQDAFWQQQGSFTGEISPQMLKSFGVKYVNLGHNERRLFAGETDSIIAKKVRAVLSQKVRPILCVGGGPEAHTAHGPRLHALIEKQLRALNGIHAADKKKLLIAFEPVAAIGSGRPASPDLIAEILTLIKKKVPQAAMIYGGSVNQKNAAELLKLVPLDGFLIGGASLRAQEFAKIVKLASIAG